MIVDDKIMNFVLYKMRTCEETKRKCQMLKFSEDYIEEVLDYLQEAGYLNDEKYTKKYIENVMRLKKSSANGIKIDLYRKGIDDGLIEKYVDTSEVYEYEEQCCNELAFKKYQSTPDILKVKKFLIR